MCQEEFYTFYSKEQDRVHGTHMLLQEEAGADGNRRLEKGKKMFINDKDFGENETGDMMVCLASS